jgi:hypothetical protein
MAHSRSQRHKAEIHGSGVSTAPVIAAWVAGTNTVTPVPVASGKARCQRLGTDNPRISRRVSNLVANKTYRMDTTHTMGNIANGAFYRISDAANLPSGTYGEQTTSVTGPVSISFTAPLGGTVYIGLVQDSIADGNYSDTADVFTLTRTN